MAEASKKPTTEPHQLSYTEEKRLVWKIDLWLLPTLVLFYILSFLDKVNIANAAIFGLTEDLNLKGAEYNTCLVVYFVAFVVFDLPFTSVIVKIKPHVWLSISTFLFGIVSMSQGFVTSYSGLLAARFFLGVVEAGTFSCCFYVMGRWYKRSEAQKRFTIFYSSIQLAGAFGGLLASAIGLLDGRRGYAGWSWIFIVEGTFTAAIAFLFFFVLPDFPEDTKWLRGKEKDYVLKRLHEDEHHNTIAGENAIKAELTIITALRVIAKPKTVLAGFIYLSIVIPGYAYQFFAPTIIHTYTSGVIHTQLLSVPPWACGFVSAVTVATISDKLGHRFSFATVPQLLAVAGYVILLAVHQNPGARYAAMFLIVMGLYIPLPIIVCWITMNVQDPVERSIVLGFFIGFGNIGGIPSVYLFLENDAPNYYPGFGSSLALIACCIVLNCVYAWVCYRENLAIKNRRSASEAEDSHTTLNMI